jgi:hypothetical protein
MQKLKFNKLLQIMLVLFFLVLDFTTLAQTSSGPPPPSGPGTGNGDGTLEGEELPIASSKLIILAVFGMLYAFYHFRPSKSQRS